MLDLGIQQKQSRAMKAFWQCILGSMLFLAASCAQISAADHNQAPRLTFELRDGSRVIGTSPEEHLHFHSSLLGDFKLAVADIRSIDFTSTNTAQLKTVNGDLMSVQFSEENFPVKTSFGKVELAASSVKHVTVSAMAGGRPAGLVALWSGEGNGEDPVGGNTAILKDITFTDGQMGQAFCFNGYSSSIRIPAATALDLGKDDGFTISLWIKPTDVQGLHPILQWSDRVNLNLWIGIRPSENGLLRGDVAEPTQNHFVCSHPDTLTAGVFQHIAFTYDKTQGTGTLYVNGVVVAQRQLGTQLTAGTTGDLLISPRDERQGYWSSGRCFAGLMDEVALYNRALSAEEIQSVFNEEKKGEAFASPAASDGWFEDWML